MRQLPSDKYNVAWFKLAEFVARGERERALGLYKLLIHSFDDRALAYQLEGDILLSFKDVDAACLKYHNAAELYRQDARIIESAAVYEHLITLDPRSKENIIKILELYEIANIPTRLLIHLEKLSCLLIQNREFEELEFFVQDWLQKIKHNFALSFLQAITCELIKKEIPSSIVQKYLKKTIDSSMDVKDYIFLQKFLSIVAALHSHYYSEATLHVKTMEVTI